MFDSKRIGRAILYLAVMLSLAMFFAACTSFHWITPVPSLETPVPAAEAAVAEPEPGTPTIEAIPVATPEAVAETEEVGEEATDATVEQASAQAMPSPLPHPLARREDCGECHAVDSGRDPAPADHVNLTDDLCLHCHAPEEGEEAVPPLPDTVPIEFCLNCHGTFEELMARTDGYVTEDGEEVNPHMYIPHDRTDIRSCDKCHDPHPLPVVAPEEIQTADIQYCYRACHHEENFTPCNECHDEDEE